MSLATRCSACGTVFRVVQDQLKVSEGWVRCGRCNQVFNALEGLFDLDRESPPEWEPQEQDDGAREAAPGAQARDDSDAVSDLPGPADPQLVDRIDSELFGARSPTPLAPRHGDDDPTSSAGPVVRDDPLRAAPGPVDDFSGNDSGEAPDFVRRAERAQRWSRPWVRAALGLVAAVLIAMLGGQAAHHFRDDLAARHPQAASALAAWCEVAGCRIGPPRHIDDVAVESTALSRAGAPDNYKLSIVLRNHGPALVSVPSVDLALTDASGQLISRRTLDARDFDGAPDKLAAGAEANLQTVLTAGATKITGYTVELFYP